MTSSYPSMHAFDTRPRNPFGFASALDATRAFDPDAPTHVLQMQRALEPGEFERPGQEAVEIMALWGSTVLSVRHLSLPESFVIGEGSAELPVDFELSADALGAQRARLVETRGGVSQVTIPERAGALVQHSGDAEFTATNAASVPLLAGTVVELKFGKLKFRIANVPAARRTPRAGFSGVERSLLSAFGLSFAVAAGLLASFAFWLPAFGLNDDEDLDAERLYTMKQYLNASAERNLEQELDKNESGAKNAEPGAPAAAAAGREGALGKQNAPVTNRRAAVRGDSPTTELSRAQVLDAARTFGMIDLLGSLSTAAGGASSPFARNPALGRDDADAEGNLFGEEIGESGGNGLRLGGLDNGGGGHGLGVGLDGIGTCGTGHCGPSGFGKDLGRLGGTHKTGAPHITPVGTTQVTGRLPPEVVQRIVRQNYGRFRMCYENGLRSNPNLTGRVTARFVISREGSVSNVQNGGSDLPDAAVVSCVVQAFYGLSFPTPENGIVSVSYPILFSPG